MSARWKYQSRRLIRGGCRTAAGGLGPTAGKVWRVGVMGYNAQPQNIALVLEAFRDGLQKQGKL